MAKNKTRLYEIHFKDEQSVKEELGSLLASINILQETRQAVLLAAYQNEDRRRLSNQLFKKQLPIQVQEDEILWAYFPVESTIGEQSLIRSFIVNHVFYRKDTVILSVSLTYEKSKQWFDPTIL
ncbi:hypothetical protein ACQ63I_001381 [Enterococcus faecalis]|nr:hypothetical protein [Enterococcus faecalis]